MELGVGYPHCGRKNPKTLAFIITVFILQGNTEYRLLLAQQLTAYFGV